MAHRRFFHFFRRRYLRPGAFAIGSCAVRLLGAQAPAQVPPSPPAVNDYSRPSLALAQPGVGGSVPIDRPILVFRFGPGVATDVIDARSFAISIDGQDRSALFQVAPTEAWGPMAAPATDQQGALAAGPHQVAARICSVRGLCTEVVAVVNATAPATATAQQATPDRKRSFIDLILAAARKLLVP